MVKRARSGARRPRRTKRARVSRRKGGARLGRPSRGLSTSVYLFKRSYVENIVLNSSSPPGQWQKPDTGSLTQSTVFSLADLHENTDFTQLFGMYKICGVKMQMFSTSTNVNQASGAGSIADQIIVYWAPNMTGRTGHTLDEQHFLDVQSAKRRCLVNGGARPINVYHKTKQLANTYSSSVNTDYAMVRPRWVSTDETTTGHYGMDMRIQLINDAAFGAGGLKIIYTYYIACKQVQ